MRPTSLDDPATNNGQLHVDIRHDTPVLRDSRFVQPTSSVLSILGQSAVGRLGYLSLLLAALWASVIWALH
jgi:hypothetical protein